MAFGCAHLQVRESSVSSQVESGSYFNKAWVSIPQLLMDHDLWEFKALALMVSPFSNAKNTTKVFPFIRIIG
jgi:hypothetical protein